MPDKSVSLAPVLLAVWLAPALAAPPGFDQLDENGDGYISRAEGWEHLHLRDRWVEADRNNDGLISAEEYAELDGLAQTMGVLAGQENPLLDDDDEVVEPGDLSEPGELPDAPLTPGAPGLQAPDDLITPGAPGLQAPDPLTTPGSPTLDAPDALDSPAESALPAPDDPQSPAGPGLDAPEAPASPADTFDFAPSPTPGGSSP